MEKSDCAILSSPQHLQRELGLFGAVMMGLGSIVGTGIFVSIGIAAGVAGPAVIVSVAIAAVVATCNGLSSAQLAANHPVSGGTYEYGYQYLSPLFGFLAGWTFLLAKSASAATAALGFSGYLLNAFGIGRDGFLVPIALLTVLILTVVILSGMQRTNRVNIFIVSITLLTLLFFIQAGLPTAWNRGPAHFTPFVQTIAHGSQSVPGALLHASALMFVAYTGYGRIATLGEEVHDPHRTIPRAIIITLIVTMLLYISVGAVAIATIGAEEFYTATSEHAAPLEIVARAFSVPGAHWILAIGAITAMAGVLLNLILGLSRVLLAMGRRADMPRAVARLNESGTTPYIAVIAVAIVIGGLACIGSVKTTWTFSAFTVLIYYAITNLAAIHLPSEQRLYPVWIAWLGLLFCLSLAFFVETEIWIIGIGLLMFGALWNFFAQKRKPLS